MKIALLLCDESNSELLSEFGGYRNMFLDVINETDELTVFPIYLSTNEHGDIEQSFPKVEQFDGFIVSGSKAGVYEDLPWIAPLFACICDIVAANKKLLGVCFGHQAIACALGGSVSKSEKGWGIGHYQNEWCHPPANKIGWQKGQALNLLVFHQDQVDVLPEGFEVCAKSDFTPYFVTQYKNQILTTQGHPEMSSQYILGLCHMLEETVGSDVAKAGRESLLEEDDTADFRQFIKDFWISS
ncbi:MAG: type 1 glutamine amidotransferase [Marinomonas sp.]